MPPKTGGRTQQGNTPAPSQQMPGSFRPPARRTTAAPASPAPAKPQRSRQAAAQRNLQGHFRNQQRAQRQSQRQQQQSARRSSQRQQRTVQIGKQSARAVQRETGHGSFAPYQAIILAEFVTAELLVAVTPIATRQNKTGLSPYAARDMTKLLAIGGVFFLLELLAVGGTGPARLGAWFGGLVLLTVGLNEAANIARDLDIFGGGPKGGSSLGGPSQGGMGSG